MKIYKYMSDATFRKHLKSHLNGDVHLSRWDECNDPMEGYFSYLARDDHAHAVRAIVEGKARCRVCCFSRSHTNYLLWSYYTNNHQGVCLEYEVNPKALPLGCILEPVRYLRRIPKFDPNLGADDQAERILLTKTSPWGHEEEIRLIARDAQGNITIGQLKGIIFGVRFHKGDPNGLFRRELIRRTNRMGHRLVPQLYQAAIDWQTMQVDRREFDRCNEKPNTM